MSLRVCGLWRLGPPTPATPHAAKVISETLSQELAGTGVRVTDVKPGFIRTEFFGASYKTTAPEGSPCAALYEENITFYRGQDGNKAGSTGARSHQIKRRLEVPLAERGRLIPRVRRGRRCGRYRRRAPATGGLLAERRDRPRRRMHGVGQTRSDQGAQGDFEAHSFIGVGKVEARKLLHALDTIEAGVSGDERMTCGFRHVHPRIQIHAFRLIFGFDVRTYGGGQRRAHM